MINQKWSMDELNISAITIYIIKQQKKRNKNKTKTNEYAVFKIYEMFI